MAALTPQERARLQEAHARAYLGHNPLNFDTVSQVLTPSTIVWREGTCIVEHNYGNASGAGPTLWEAMIDCLINLIDFERQPE